MPARSVSARCPRPPTCTTATVIPVGTCWECHIFGCHSHAAVDADAGYFLCTTSVAHGLAVSAGIADYRTEVRFRSSEDFARRFAASARPPLSRLGMA